MTLDIILLYLHITYYILSLKSTHMANRYDNNMSTSKSIFDENIILRGVISVTSCIILVFGYLFGCLHVYFFRKS